MALQHFGEEYGNNAPENYERFFVPAIGGPLAHDLVGHAKIQPDERVLDIACGTGAVTRLAAERTNDTGAVTGLDINGGMLAVAREVCPPGINWVEASAEKIPLPDNSFDVVLCQISLMFIPDKLKALREMYRVLTPGGRIVLSAPGPASPVWEAFAESLQEYAGLEAAGFVKRVFSLYDTAEIEKLLADAGFKNASFTSYVKQFTLPAPKDFLWQYVKSTPLGSMLSGADDDKLRELEDKLVRRWNDFEADGNLTDNLTILVAGAQK